MARCFAPMAAWSDLPFPRVARGRRYSPGDRNMNHVIVVTGASSGFGLLSAQALAHAGHTVYAGMRETAGRNAPRVSQMQQYAKEQGVDLRAIEMDVASQASVDAAIAQIIATHGRLDV